MAGSDVKDPADRINEALLQLGSCLNNALPDICLWWITINGLESFGPDEDEELGDDCDDLACSRWWIAVDSIAPVIRTTGMDGNSCSYSIRLELTVGISRCFTLPDEGEDPTITDVSTLAFQSNSDAITILNTALCCEAWDSITAGSWLLEPYEGTMYGGTWTFTVELENLWTDDAVYPDYP